MNHFLFPAKSERGAKYCVPTAMSAITGLSARECRAKCENVARRSLPRGITIETYYIALQEMGYWLAPKRFFRPYPTLGRVVKKTNRKAIIVILSGPRRTHAIAYNRGYVCDNMHPKPIKLASWVRQRGLGMPRVTHITEIL